MNEIQLTDHLVAHIGAERLAAALTRYGEYRMLPCFGWMILIVRDHKNERHDEKRN